MKYAIVCDSMYVDGEIIAMTDPGPGGSRWTATEYGSVRIFNDLAEAESVAKKLRYNNPRVMALEDMEYALDEQAEQREVIAGGIDSDW